MSRFADRALLLRRYPFGESSLVAHVLTREHGRVHLLAKGAYRPTSRCFAVLDMFDTLAVEWSGPERRELKTLHAGQVAVRRRRIARDLARFRAAVAMLELADLAARAEHRDRGLFDLLEASFAELDAGRLRPDLALTVFELGFLQNAGLSPALERCAACAGPAAAVAAGGRGPYRARAAFSAGAGGRLCRACAEEARASGRRVGTLPVSVLETAHELLRAGPSGAAAHAGLEPARIERVRDFVGRFLDYHLEARPRTQRAFLAAPNRNAP